MQATQKSNAASKKLNNDNITTKNTETFELKENTKRDAVSRLSPQNFANLLGLGEIHSSFLIHF